MKPSVIIVGGVLNSTLKKWLWNLGIVEYNVMSTTLTSIDPEELERTAERIRDMLPANAVILSVGNIADKLLNRFFVVHGSLPSTTCKDKKLIETAIGRCRNYLIMRSYYGIQSQPTSPKPS